MNPHLIRARRRGVPGILDVKSRRFYPMMAGGAPTLAELRQKVTDAAKRMGDAYDALEAADPTADGVDVDALQRAFDEAETAHEEATKSLKRAEKVDEARRNAPVQPENPAPGGPTTVRAEPLTYSRHKRNVSWLLDLARAQFGRGDVEGAQQRLARHEKEISTEIRKREEIAEKRSAAALDDMLAGLPEPLARAIADSGLIQTRDMTRVDGAGGHFVPPLHLLEMYAEFPRGARPFVDSVRNIPLPSGTDSINIPRITTASLTGVQTADNAAVTEQDMVDAVVTAPVRTIAGQVDLALQLLEQSPIAFDEITFADLIADYYFRTEDQAWNGSGASGQVLGILNVAGVNAVTYTDASPTVPELYPKIADALSQARTARKRPITSGWMAGRRLYWLTAALDAQSRPLVVPQYAGPNNANGVLNTATADEDASVMLHGVRHRITDAMPVNLGAGTNEDRIVETREADHVFFEGTIRARAMSEVLSGNLTARLQVYSYVAFTAGRFPAATSVIAGTGLVTPTF